MISAEGQAMLVRQEGWQPFLYDDATGKRLVRGSFAVGNPTIGVGYNLGARGLPSDMIRELYKRDIDTIDRGLRVQYPWYANLDANRQGVLINMAFNVGMVGLAGFREVISALAAADYAKAALAMLSSRWAKEVPDRAEALASIMSSGEYGR